MAWDGGEENSLVGVKLSSEPGMLPLAAWQSPWFPLLHPVFVLS